jgi:uncharacterized sulfatase
LDFFPSITRLAGIEAAPDEKIDGEDLSSVLIGKTKAKRTKALFWNRPPDRPGDHGQTWPDLAIREKDWKLLLMADGSNPQLFDLANDPGETRNLAEQHPEFVATWRWRLHDWASVQKALILHRDRVKRSDVVARALEPSAK